ncbi:uncharacterized protein LOC143453020 [Clavelina lepadiformis]|uniref:uncharacterized protein LOC143453020 n=1 Tax=Clavelina lepadiformis TaxID=159417 RepID=UPI004041B625
MLTFLSNFSVRVCIQHTVESYFLKTTSDLLQPSRECIDEYAVSNRAGARFRAKRQTSSNVYERSGFFPNSPQFRFYTACYDNEINLPTGRADVDFLTVAQFVNEDVVCNPEFLGCDANNEDVTLPDWLYRMQAVTREGSPVRDALAICNNRPTPPPQDSYGERRQTSFVECTTKTLTLLRSNAIFSSIGDIIVTPGFLRDAWVLCSYAKPQQPLGYCINRLFTLLVIDDPIIVDPTVIPFPTLLPPLPTAPLPSLILRFAPKEFAVLFCSVL